MIVFKQVNLDLLTINSKVMEFTYFIGTDVSKNELDLQLCMVKHFYFIRRLPIRNAILLFIKE